MTFKPKQICIRGQIRGQFINEIDWETCVKEFKEQVEMFNKSKKALPHPGIIINFDYCPFCGRKF